MPEYFVWRLNPLAFEVRKFTPENNAMQAKYTLAIIKGPKGPSLTCDCISGTHRSWLICRHQKMIGEFLKAGEPIPFSVEVK